MHSCHMQCDSKTIILEGLEPMRGLQKQVLGRVWRILSCHHSFSSLCFLTFLYTYLNFICITHIKININYSPYKHAYHLISLSMIMQHHSACQVLYEYKQNDQGLNGFVKISASCCSVITKDRGTLYFPT